MPRCPRLVLTAVLVAATLGAVPAMFPRAALAQTEDGAARARALVDLIGMDAIFEVMAQEGRAYGDDLAAGMFPDTGLDRWSRAVAAIYDPARMADRFDLAFAAALEADPEALAAGEAFFGSPLGQEVLKLELEARRVLLDDAAEEAANVEAQRLQEDRDPRLRLIRDLIDAGDLVEANVAGAMTASLAFALGMAEEMPGEDPPLADMMADAWAQESAIRAESGAWLLSYMALAYQPLSDDQMRAYVDYSETPEGKRVNAALFSAFDAVFTPIFRDLGRAAARHAQSDDI